MKDDRKSRPEVEEEQGDEIEILEVVGLDEDLPTGSERDAAEIDVSFDEAGGAAVPAGSPSGDSGAPPSVEEEPLQERLLRLQADFENFKKRVDRERGDFYRQATASLVARLLPVIDNLERALATGPKSDEKGAFREGVILIHRQLLEELKKEGLVPIDCVGQTFDPNLHEAVATDNSSTIPADTVIEELQRGYRFQDHLLRAAGVRVSLGPPGDKDEGGGGEES